MRTIDLHMSKEDGGVEAIFKVGITPWFAWRMMGDCYECGYSVDLALPSLNGETNYPAGESEEL